MELAEAAPIDVDDLPLEGWTTEGGFSERNKDDVRTARLQKMSELPLCAVFLREVLLKVLTRWPNPLI